MANESKKRSNFMGLENEQLEQYVIDVDRDIANLFEEKTFNIKHVKRYAMTIAATYSS